MNFHKICPIYNNDVDIVFKKKTHCSIGQMRIIGKGNLVQCKCR